MNKLDLEYILKILNKIKEPDGHIKKAIATVERDLAQYQARKGQMCANYEPSDYDW